MQNKMQRIRLWKSNICLNFTVFDSFLQFGFFEYL